jgi:hypothetical protein
MRRSGLSAAKVSLRGLRSRDTRPHRPRLLVKMATIESTSPQHAHCSLTSDPFAVPRIISPWTLEVLMGVNIFIPCAGYITTPRRGSRDLLHTSQYPRNVILFFHSRQTGCGCFLRHHW